MALKPPVHTVPHGDGWANRREGASRVSKTFNTKFRRRPPAGNGPAGADRTRHPQP